MSVSVTVDDRDLHAAIRDFPKQARFAAALALTRTAQDAQAEVKRQLPQRFTIRSRWIEKGIRIRPATKTRLESAVIVLDDFMAAQETGGVKRPRTGRAVAIPVGARRTPTAATRPSRFPRAILAKPGHFVAPLAPASGRVGVWRRTHGSRRLMYLLAPFVRIRPRFEFFETVGETARMHLGVNFQAALREAMATARGSH